jgi:SPP1 gp7 family putative phage head morphogenesis protein
MDYGVFDKVSLNLEKEGEKQETSLEKEIIREYKKTLGAIQAVLSTAFVNYSNEEDKLSYEEMMKYNRLKTLEKQLTDEIMLLSKGNATLLNKELGSMLSESYLQMGYLLESAVGTGLGIVALDREAIKASVQNNLTGLTLNERLEKNRNDLIISIRSTLTQGLIQNNSYKQMVKQVQSKLESDASKAVRIVRTESSRIRTEGRLQAMKKANERGLKMKKMWVASLDSRTRDTHQHLDGQVVGFDELFEYKGRKAEAPQKFGRAEEDINCRCRIVARFDDQNLEERAARNSKGFTENIKNQTYQEWKKNKK